MTFRDDIRFARTEINNVAKELGINADAERSKDGATPRTISHDILKLINDATPRVTEKALQLDDPPDGAFNGANTIFNLSQPVAGENIIVIWGDTANNNTWPLVKGNANPPANHEFFFDRNEPDVIVVGNPPLSTDRLMAIYKPVG